MAAILDYTSSRFNRLPDIDVAVNIFSARQASSILSDILGPMIVENGMARNLAVALLHSHFPLPNGGKLVHFGNTAMPLSSKQVQSCSDKIHPLSWQFVEGLGISPYEFTYSEQYQPPGLQLTMEMKEFLQILGSVLVKHELADVLGVQLQLPEAGEDNDNSHKIEITTGDASITLPKDVFKDALDTRDGFEETTWVFQRSPEGIVSKKCKTTCKIRAGTHRSLHLTTRK